MIMFALTMPSAVLFAALVLCGAGYAVAYVRLHLRQNSRWRDLFQAGEWLLYEEKKPLESLMHLCEASALKEHHETEAMIGAALDAMGHPTLAAEAYRKARVVLWRSTKHIPCPSLVSKYYWLESYAYASAGSWKWAYTRAKEGLFNTACRFVDEIDCEAELRVVRMVSSLYHLKGSEAIRVSRDDANWIIENSENAKHRVLAERLLDTGFRLEAAASEAWKRYLSRN